ncbi:MAG: methylated-DNA--[protein]-cysteine S-methyltransferase [Actinobacteria bacterium]|nr:methylated-DNA--[protein]-cysteine S-methyltransferase [Actinomycetota bacterium]
MTAGASRRRDRIDWLGDSGRPAQDDDLMRLLDAAYGAGPEEAEIMRAQARLRQAVAQARGPVVYYGSAPRTSIGTVFAAVGERGLVALDFGVDERTFVERVRARSRGSVIRSQAKAEEALQQVREYLAAKRARFDLPLDLGGTSEFQRKVLLVAAQIPRGQYRTYHQVAQAIGKPKAARAVGQALGHNPVPLVIPCHRVLGSDGSLHGYSGGGGLKTKAWLLRLEGVRLPETG